MGQGSVTLGLMAVSIRLLIVLGLVLLIVLCFFQKTRRIAVGLLVLIVGVIVASAVAWFSIAPQFDMTPGRLTIGRAQPIVIASDGKEYLIDPLHSIPPAPWQANAQMSGGKTTDAERIKKEGEEDSPPPPSSALPQAKEGSDAPTTAKAEDAKADATKESARPAWVDAAPKLIDDTYQMTVAVGPYASLLECDAKTPEALRDVVNQYAEIATGEPVVVKLTSLDAAFCRQLVKERWEEVTQHPFGAMYQLHLLLQFDRKAKEEIIDACRDRQVERRLWQVGAAALAVLGLLAAAYGCLKIAPTRKNLQV
jgi:hypothetical protein